ncbi:MAG: helix-turn-helix transcriptional regulator [Bacilli bacterium]|nr:helix-turn-helix transcriptional regulator [Bacilli bacterium]
MIKIYKQRIKILRKEQEIKQEDISMKLNCKRPTYANWESNVIVISVINC